MGEIPRIAIEHPSLASLVDKIHEDVGMGHRVLGIFLDESQYRAGGLLSERKIKWIDGAVSERKMIFLSYNFGCSHDSTIASIVVEKMKANIVFSSLLMMQSIRLPQNYFDVACVVGNSSGQVELSKLLAAIPDDIRQIYFLDDSGRAGGKDAYREKAADLFSKLKIEFYTFAWPGDQKKASTIQPLISPSLTAGQSTMKSTIERVPPIHFTPLVSIPLRTTPPSVPLLPAPELQHPPTPAPAPALTRAPPHQSSRPPIDQSRSLIPKPSSRFSTSTLGPAVIPEVLPMRAPNVHEDGKTGQQYLVPGKEDVERAVREGHIIEALAFFGVPPAGKDAPPTQKPEEKREFPAQKPEGIAVPVPGGQQGESSGSRDGEKKEREKKVRAPDNFKCRAVRVSSYDQIASTAAGKLLENRSIIAIVPSREKAESLRDLLQTIADDKKIIIIDSTTKEIKDWASGYIFVSPLTPIPWGFNDVGLLDIFMVGSVFPVLGLLFSLLVEKEDRILHAFVDDSVAAEMAKNGFLF